MWQKFIDWFRKRKARAARVEPQAAQTEPEIVPLIKWDFITWFPHKFWVSDWSKDSEYPGGFRYKLLSVRNEKDRSFELVVALEEPGSVKTEMERLVLSPESAFDRAAGTFLKSLSEKHQIEFEVSDMSDIRSDEEWDEWAEDAGFGPWEPPKPQ